MTGKLAYTEHKGWVVRFNFVKEIVQEFDGEVLSTTTRYEELPVHPDTEILPGMDSGFVNFEVHNIAVGTSEFDVTDKDVAVII